MTFFDTSGQALIFLLLLYAGAALGAMYDLLSPIRRRSPKLVATALDALWCVMAAALCFFALALGGEGHLRPYALLGLCCGGGIYCLGVRSVGKAVAARIRKRKSS